MKLEDAVNNALDDLSLVENKRFINLMTAIWEHVDDADINDQSIVDTYEEAKMAVGEFVPAITIKGQGL